MGIEFPIRTITIDLDGREFHISDAKSLWAGRSLYDLYAEAQTPWEWNKSIFDRAWELRMLPFSTPFDQTAVDFLEELGVPCYRIASFENIDLPLVWAVAATGKPVTISTGMATVAEIDDAVGAARGVGCRDLVLLKCTGSYPATPETTNVLTTPNLRERFQCEVGLSDHTMGIGVAAASVALGATVSEKHFTLSRVDGGVDSAFSLEPAEMTQLVVETERAWQGLGEVSYGSSVAEKNSLQFRRSLYITRDLKAGDVLTGENVRAIRPGLGLPPKYLDQILGRRVSRAAARGTALSWDIVGGGPDQ